MAVSFPAQGALFNEAVARPQVNFGLFCVRLRQRNKSVVGVFSVR